MPDFRRDLGRLAALDFKARLALVRAVAELLGARLRLALVPTRDLVGKRAGAGLADQQRVAEIVLAIRRVAARLPWRATCLVQALAAQHWLASRGIGSSIHLGVKASEQPIDAHAWLKVGGRTVLGGDVADYAEFPLHDRR